MGRGTNTANRMHSSCWYSTSLTAKDTTSKSDRGGCIFGISPSCFSSFLSTSHGLCQPIVFLISMTVFCNCRDHDHFESRQIVAAFSSAIRPKSWPFYPPFCGAGLYLVSRGLSIAPIIYCKTIWLRETLVYLCAYCPFATPIQSGCSSTGLSSPSQNGSVSEILVSPDTIIEAGRWMTDVVRTRPWAMLSSW